MTKPHICSKKSREATKEGEFQLQLVDDSTALKVLKEMTQREFPKRVGVTYQAVINWVARGYLPIVQRGWRKMVNTGALAVSLIEGGEYRWDETLLGVEE